MCFFFFKSALKNNVFLEVYFAKVYIFPIGEKANCEQSEQQDLGIDKFCKQNLMCFSSSSNQCVFNVYFVKVYIFHI